MQVFCDNYLDGGYHVPCAHKNLASSLNLDTYTTEVCSGFLLVRLILIYTVLNGALYSRFIWFLLKQLLWRSCMSPEVYLWHRICSFSFGQMFFHLRARNCEHLQNKFYMGSDNVYWIRFLKRLASKRVLAPPRKTKVILTGSDPKLCMLSFSQTSWLIGGGHCTFVILELINDVAVSMQLAFTS